MENKKQLCPIWGDTVARIIRCHDKDAFVVEGSPRISGDYKISAQAIQDVGAMDPKDKAKLTTILLELRRAGNRVPLVTCDLVEKVKNADPLSVQVRAERLLRYLVNKLQPVGQPFNNQTIIEAPESSAWSESTSPTEVQFFVDYLATRGWLKKISHYFFMITVVGYEHVAEQTTKKDLAQCFVAMWFDDSTKQAYEDGIKKAVEECGYKPLRIDEKLGPVYTNATPRR